MTNKGRDKNKFMDWINVRFENDLPVNGQLVIVCRDLIETKQYYVTKWSDEDKKYWELNDIIGWAEIHEFE